VPAATCSLGACSICWRSTRKLRSSCAGSWMSWACWPHPRWPREWLEAVLCSPGGFPFCVLSTASHANSGLASWSVCCAVPQAAHGGAE
jgi:hypothetical protein